VEKLMLDEAMHCVMRLTLLRAQLARCVLEQAWRPVASLHGPKLPELALESCFLHIFSPMAQLDLEKPVLAQPMPGAMLLRLSMRARWARCVLESSLPGLCDLHSSKLAQSTLWWLLHVKVSPGPP
jgi:hypothetical protein